MRRDETSSSVATEELFRTIDWTSGGDKSGRKSSKLFAKVIAKIQKWFLDHWWWALVSFCWNLSTISLIFKVLGVWFIFLKYSSLPITRVIYMDWGCASSTVRMGRQLPSCASFLDMPMFWYMVETKQPMKEINQKGLNTLTIFQHGEVTITAFQTLLLCSVWWVRWLPDTCTLDV